MPRRTILGFLLLVAMLLPLAAFAQQAAQPGPVYVVRPGPGPDFVPRDRQGRPIKDLATLPENRNPQGPEQDEAWVDQEMYRIRRDLTRQAVNRMRSAGFESNRRPLIEDVLHFTGPFLIFLVITGFILWFIRTLMENRRWDKMARIQTDAHTKLLDKLGTSPELVSYIESDAGKRFLEATPFDLGYQQKPSFPLTRILWSAQAGVVVIVLGAGLLWLSGRFTEEDARGLLVFGTLCFALGVGLLLSAGVSFFMSKRLGLLNGESKATGQVQP